MCAVDPMRCASLTNIAISQYVGSKSSAVCLLNKHIRAPAVGLGTYARSDTGQCTPVFSRRPHHGARGSITVQPM
jgi:hypothetical protein